MAPEQMAAEAAIAIAGGTRMTMVRKRGMKMPPKFPRGELLCENHEGRHVYSYDPLRVLAWLSATGLVKVTATTKTPNAMLTGARASGAAKVRPL